MLLDITHKVLDWQAYYRKEDLNELLDDLVPKDMIDKYSFEYERYRGMILGNDGDYLRNCSWSKSYKVALEFSTIESYAKNIDDEFPILYSVIVKKKSKFLT